MASGMSELVLNTKVSDPYYFNDFDSKYGSSTDGYATQIFSAGYAVQNFDATVSTKQFQVFDSQNTSTYGSIAIGTRTVF